MNPATIAKAAVDIIVSTGVGAVVGNAIKMSTPLDATITKKISIGVGGFVLSGMVGSHAAKYTGEQIDTTLTQVRALKETLTKK